MANINELKQFNNFGMDGDSAYEDISPEDVVSAYNLRNSTGEANQRGYGVDIESTTLLPANISPPTGITKGIAAYGFKNILQAPVIRYNSAGYHQIGYYNYDTDDFTILYEDKTDSAGVQILNLNPQKYPILKLVNDTYLVFTDGYSSVGFLNFTKLKNGGYGTVTPEDFSLIKPQNLVPISAVYASDAGKAANFIKGKLWQFISQYVGQEFTYSAWSTWSKRIIPDAESTPDVGTDSRVNNCIIVSVIIGTDRVQTINIGARQGNSDYGIIKSVDRSYVIALPDTAVDISTQVYEAYDPATNIYSFVFYNDSIIIPVAPTETDLAYDHVPLTAEAAEILNGNIISLGGLTEGYERPETQVNITTTGYNPNISVPINTEPNPVRVIFTFNSGAGSGLGNHVRLLRVGYDGIPHTGDKFTIVLYDVRTGVVTHTYNYTVPSGLDGQLTGNVGAFGTQLQAATMEVHGSQAALEFRGDPYEEIQSASITLNVSGAAQSKSIHALLDNSSYQLALSYRDAYGRYLPLRTGNEFIVKTQSFAQLTGNTPIISWQINSAAAPQSAVDYQWLLTKNSSVNTMLDVLANPINYKGVWNANDNMPELAPNIGTVGDTYQVGAPSQLDDHRNLGNGEQEFNTGDYVVYNGASWDVVSKSFADLTSSSTVMAFKINPLNLFNVRYANEGTSTVLTYDFSQGDRATLHAYYNGTTPVYLNNPCIDVQVLGYDAASYIVKMEKSSAINLGTIGDKDFYIRLYSPKEADQTVSTVQNGTIFYEIGERFTITNGVHDTLSGQITDGDVYFKTRVYQGAVDPSSNYEVLATDFNFSDFYDSAFTSYGRPRTYNDELEHSERKAIIRYSQNYVLGSKNNGLTRFYAETIYGNADGETSSNYEWIQQLWQRGQQLLVFQELNIGYVPVFETIITDKIEQAQIGISQKLLNVIRYADKGIGIGRAKESFCTYEDTAFFVDPFKSEPIRAGLDGIEVISRKMSTFFKRNLIDAYKQGIKIIGYFDVYFKDYILSIQKSGGTLTYVDFDSLGWNIYNDNNITPSDVVATANGAHSTVSYNNTTGLATYTPTSNYVGNDVATFTFNGASGSITKNNCLNWQAGTTTVNQFNFADKTDALLSTQYVSNSILVSGNDVPVPVSIANGEYQINEDGWTSADGTANLYDVIAVRRNSSPTIETTVGATLTVSDKSDTFDITTGTDQVAPFSFTAQTGQPISTVIISNTITVSGNTIPAAISITGGQYSINGDTYTSSAGTVNAGDIITVKQTSSGSYHTSTTATLTIDGQSSNFVVTTAYVDAFVFTPVYDAPLSTIETSNTVTITGEDIAPYPISITGGEYSINGGAYTSADGTINIGDTVSVQCESSASESMTTSCTLTILDMSSTFSVTTGVILQPFDFLVIRTIWDSVGGTDLDTATGFNGTGTAYDIDYTGNSNWVGYNPVQVNYNTIATGGTPLYMQWAGDDTTSGVEAILIDFALFATDNPSLLTIQALLYTIWYNTRGTGDIQVQLETYLGGTMTKVGFDFVNSGGVVVDNITIPRNVTATGTTANINADQLVGTIDYDTVNKTATLT